MGVFANIGKLTTIHVELQGSKAQTILKNTNNVGGVILPGFKCTASVQLPNSLVLA